MPRKRLSAELADLKLEAPFAVTLHAEDDSTIMLSLSTEAGVFLSTSVKIEITLMLPGELWFFHFVSHC